MMVEVGHNKVIRMSYGDKFSLDVEINDFTPVSSNTYWLSVKKVNTVLLDLQATSVVALEDGVSLHFEANTATMKQLPVNDYVYDIYVRNADGDIITIMFTAAFNVEKVAHNA